MEDATTQESILVNVLSGSSYSNCVNIQTQYLLNHLLTSEIGLSAALSTVAEK